MVAKQKFWGPTLFPQRKVLKVESRKTFKITKQHSMGVISLHTFGRA